MAKDDSLGGGAVLLAFVAGAVAGAAVALLFAPATGEETREFSASARAKGARKWSMPHASSGAATEPEA